MHKLPNFICLGAQKAGTTQFFNLLSQHPDVFVPPEKEVHYFDRDENFEKGLKWYADFYSKQKDEKILADISPDYMFFDWVPQRMKEVLGEEVKLLFLLRNPVERAYSQYNMYRSRDIFVESFTKEVEKEKVNPNSPEYHTSARPPYFISKSIYYPQLKRFYQHFPPDNIKVLLFEEFVSDLNGSMNEVCDFLSIGRINFNSTLNKNKTVIYKKKGIYRTMNKPLLRKVIDGIKAIVPECVFLRFKNRLLSLIGKKPEGLDNNYKKYLWDHYFAEDVEALKKLTGRNLDCWSPQNTNHKGDH